MKQKKLQRQIANKWIFGVCSGLAEYLNIDVILVRVLFILLLLASAPAAIIGYLLLAVMIPANDENTDYAANTDDKVTSTGGKSESGDNSNVFLGTLLIVIGLIFLFDDFFAWISWKKLWPVILIVLGIHFVLQSFGKDEDEIVVNDTSADAGGNNETAKQNGSAEPDETGIE